MPEPSKMMTRRAALGAVAAAGITASGPLRAGTPARKRPNVIFIMADDLGYADVSCYGRRDYRTPHIDSLAEQGMRFEHSYANSSVCTPTRVGLITGRYQYRLPIGLEEPLVMRNVGLPSAHPTLPSLLRQAGYKTALVGKWHMGSLPDYGPLQSGYDHFWGYRAGGIDYFTHGAIGRPDLWDGDTPIEKSGYLTTLLGDRAVATIETLAIGDRPFFMSLHFSAPHWPWEGEEDEAVSRRQAKVKGFAGLMHYDGGDMKTYAAMVMAMDRQIGRVLGKLKEKGIDNDTIVVFTSDNGGERFSDTWPFKGIKTELLEGGIRVPAIIRWPGHVAAGGVSQQIVISMDWAPTLLRIGGGKAHAEYPFDGADLTHVLTGGKPFERTLFWRHKLMLQRACRQGPWKYLRIKENDFLFNVVDDPMERANLKERLPDVFRQLKASWTAWDKTMLPIDPASSSHGFTARELADHFGVPEDAGGLMNPASR